MGKIEFKKCGGINFITLLDFAFFFTVLTVYICICKESCITTLRVFSAIHLNSLTVLSKWSCQLHMRTLIHYLVNLFFGLCIKKSRHIVQEQVHLSHLENVVIIP